MKSLFEAVHEKRERSEWHDRPDAFTEVRVPEIITDPEAARQPQSYPDKFEDESRFERWPIPKALRGSTVLVVGSGNSVEVEFSRTEGLPIDTRCSHSRTSQTFWDYLVRERRP
jgi:hypothetical protein